MKNPLAIIEYIQDEWLKLCIEIHWKWYTFTKSWEVPTFTV